jgi:hypothetical protein
VSVTVDHEPLAVENLGLDTVGQVLAHLQKDHRLVVQVLIDGNEPQVGGGTWRQTALAGHAVYVETADPRELAMDVLDSIASQLGDAERLKAEAADLLGKNQTAKAMQQLGGCVRIWQHADETVNKTAELLRVNLKAVDVHGRAMEAVLGDFAEQLRQIKGALEQRDFVALSDVLLYETTQTTENWQACIEAMRELVKGL